ncbi:MAG: hypothetical protein SGPRY_014397, partial [Prymnesium sp.]
DGMRLETLRGALAAWRLFCRRRSQLRGCEASAAGLCASLRLERALYWSFDSTLLAWRREATLSRHLSSPPPCLRASLRAWAFFAVRLTALAVRAASLRSLRSSVNRWRLRARLYLATRALSACFLSNSSARRGLAALRRKSPLLTPLPSALPLILRSFFLRFARAARARLRLELPTTGGAMRWVVRPRDEKAREGERIWRVMEREGGRIAREVRMKERLRSWARNAWLGRAGNEGRERAMQRCLNTWRLTVGGWGLWRREGKGVGVVATSRALWRALVTWRGRELSCERRCLLLQLLEAHCSESRLSLSPPLSILLTPPLVLPSSVLLCVCMIWPLDPRTRRLHSATGKLRRQRELRRWGERHAWLFHRGVASRLLSSAADRLKASASARRVLRVWRELSGGERRGRQPHAASHGARRGWAEWAARQAARREARQGAARSLTLAFSHSKRSSLARAVRRWGARGGGLAMLLLCQVHADWRSCAASFAWWQRRARVGWALH